MRFFADLLVFVGAILLTLETDLVIIAAGVPAEAAIRQSIAVIGAIASLIGVALLTTGILNHCRLSRVNESEEAAGLAAEGREKPGGRRR
jgi:uncharacterized membrane protein